jgi:hypothetical protein
MSKYTLQIRGEPLDDAVAAVSAAGGIKASSAIDWAAKPEPTLTVTVDAPSLQAAEAKLGSALPEHGAYAVARPEPLEDDEEDPPPFL